MQIPQIFFGKEREVAKNLRPLVRRFLDGETLASIFSALPMVDTAEIPWRDEGLYKNKSGMIVLGDAGTMLTGTPNFWVALLSREIRALQIQRKKAPSHESLSSIVNECCLHPWSLLALVSRFAQGIVRGHEGYILSVVRQFFPVYQAEGPRFTSSGIGGGPFWGLYDSFLYGLMERAGADRELLLPSREENLSWKRKLPDFQSFFPLGAERKD